MNWPRSTDLVEADTLEPTFESFQTPLEVIVIAHLPSVVKEELKLDGNSQALTIKIVGPADPQQLSRMGYYSHEIVKLYGFSKTITFPTQVDFSRVKATFKHGVLEVRAPKL